MTRYSTGYGAYEITPVPGQPQIARRHSFFIHHARRAAEHTHGIKSAP